MTREQLENLVWENKHPDFRGVTSGQALEEMHARAVKAADGGPHHLALSACNCWMGEAARSRRKGVRNVLWYEPGVGTTLAYLPLMSLGQLADSLPSGVRQHCGLALWRLVLCGRSNVVLGRFGSEAWREAEACSKRVHEQTGVRPKVEFAVGLSIPHVGEVYDEGKHSTLDGARC